MSGNETKHDSIGKGFVSMDGRHRGPTMAKLIQIEELKKHNEDILKEEIEQGEIELEELIILFNENVNMFVKDNRSTNEGVVKKFIKTSVFEMQEKERQIERLKKTLQQSQHTSINIGMYLGHGSKTRRRRRKKSKKGKGKTAKGRVCACCKRHRCKCKTRKNKKKMCGCCKRRKCRCNRKTKHRR
jgi:hypothetical protein